MTRWLRVRVAVDRALAVGLGVVAGPVVAGLAVVIRRHDGGPPLVRLIRVGQGGQRFEMWKLRTMHVGGPGGRAGGPPIASYHDDRVTPIGRRIRRWRLDELPQLYNVVRGEMALLGPRPETPEYVDLGDESWQRVLRGRPGIAGPTQLAVHEMESVAIASDGGEELYRDVILPAKLAIDAWYVEQASPFIDLLVIVGLVERFLLRRQALVLDGVVSRHALDLGAVRERVDARAGCEPGASDGPT
ncbi:MAG: sugar transferase [Actinomycetota bacterium]|nr:sugar transferase [Actinomycetota bacterium]MDQ6949035.1 sugar transferase [Actinomycetota bacterium]